MADNEVDKLIKEWSAMVESTDLNQGDKPPPSDRVPPAGGTPQAGGAPQAGAPKKAGATPPPAQAAEPNYEEGEGLSQEEIDALLGTQVEDSSSNVGFSLLTDTRNVGENRLALLDVIYERLVRRASTSLRKFSSDSIDINLDTTDLIRFGDYLNSVGLPAMIGVFRAEEWDNYGIITLDSNLIYSIIEVLLGGHRSKSTLNRSRAYTELDTSLIEKFVSVILDDLTAAFDPIYPVTIRLERIETNPRFAAFTLPTNVSHRGRFLIDIDDRGGILEIVMPLATLEPVRDILSQSFLGEKFGRDVVWENHFRNSLSKTRVEINALLSDRYMNLCDVLSWKEGQVIELGNSPTDPITVSCNGKPIFKATMGNRDGRLAVQMKTKIPIDKRLANADTIV